MIDTGFIKFIFGCLRRRLRFVGVEPRLATFYARAAAIAFGKVLGSTDSTVFALQFLFLHA